MTVCRKPSTAFHTLAARTPSSRVIVPDSATRNFRRARRAPLVRSHRRGRLQPRSGSAARQIGQAPGLPATPARRGRRGSQLKGGAKRPRAATPKAPLTWEGRPHTLRSAPGPDPRKQQKSRFWCPLTGGAQAARSAQRHALGRVIGDQVLLPRERQAGVAVRTLASHQHQRPLRGSSRRNNLINLEALGKPPCASLLL